MSSSAIHSLERGRLDRRVTYDNTTEDYCILHVWLCIIFGDPLREGLDRRVTYGVATVSRIDKIIGLFCRISSLL